MSTPQGDRSGSARTALEALPGIRRLLVDLGLCPGCAAELPGPVCPSCGIDLSGPEGARIIQLSGTAAAALEQREVVLGRLRILARSVADQAPMPGAAPVPPSAPPPAADLSAAPADPPAPVPAAPPVPGRPPGPERPPRPRISISTLLVGVGALLLAVAAIGFLVFSWHSLPLGGRAVVVGAATLTALTTAAWLRPRLPETAEALGALSVVLVLGDCWAIRSTGLLHADEVAGLRYAGSAVLVSAVLLGAWGRVGRLRAGSLAATLMLPLGIMMSAAALLPGEQGWVWVLALSLGAASTPARRFLPAPWRAERVIARLVAGWMLAATAGAAWLGLLDRWTTLGALALTTALTAAQTWADPPDPTTEPAQLGEIRPNQSRPNQSRPNQSRLNRFWSALTGVGATVTAVSAAQLVELAAPYRMLTLAVAPFLVLVAVSRLRPVEDTVLRRTALAIAVLGTALVLVIPTVVRGLFRVVLSRFPDAAPEPISRWAALLGCLFLLAGLTWLAGWRSRRPDGPWPAQVHRMLRLIVATLSAAAMLVLALTPGAPVGLTVGALLVVAVGASVTAVRYGTATALRILAVRVPAALVPAVTAVVAGTLAVLLSWTTRNLGGPVTLSAALALFAARRRFPGERQSALRFLLALVGTGTAITALVLLADQTGPDRFGNGSAAVPAAWAAGLGAAWALSRLPAALRPRPGRVRWSPADRLGVAGLVVTFILAVIVQDAVNGDLPAWGVTQMYVTLLLIALAGTLLPNLDVKNEIPFLPTILAAVAPVLLGPVAVGSVYPWLSISRNLALIWAGCTALGTAALTVLVIRHPSPPQQRRRAAEIGLLITGLVAVGVDPLGDRLWLVLLILGVCAAAVALTPDRARVGLSAGVLLTASSWVRLAGAEVSLIEAYTVPPALFLLGFQLWTGRRSAPAGARHTGLRPALIGVLPSVVAVGTAQPVVRPIVLLVLGATAVVVGLRRSPSTALATGGALTAAATALLRAGHDLLRQDPEVTGIPLTTVEVWTVPAALIVLLHGVDRFHRRERTSPPGQRPAPSWLTLLPGLALLILPGLLCCLAGFDDRAARPVLVVLAAAVVAAVGAQRRIQAALLFGCGSLTVEALVLLAPWMRAAGRSVPLWAWAAAAGIALLILGGGYERRLAQARAVRARIAQLR